jgi:hypothetical protein
MESVISLIVLLVREVIVQSLTTTMLNEEVIMRFTPGVAGSTYGIVDVVVTM